MRTMILVCMCLTLIASVIMAFMVLKAKEKKGSTYAYLALFIVTILVSLRMILKLLGIF